MTKRDIITLITNKTGLDSLEVSASIEAFITTVKRTVRAGKKVTLRGFGSFDTVHRKQKKGRNIGAGTEVIIPACNVVKFTPSKYFKVDQPQQL